MTSVNARVSDASTKDPCFPYLSSFQLSMTRVPEPLPSIHTILMKPVQVSTTLPPFNPPTEISSLQFQGISLSLLSPQAQDINERSNPTSPQSGRFPIQKTPRKNWDEQDMHRAMEMVKTNRMTIKAAAEECHVPKSTLGDRLLKVKAIKRKTHSKKISKIR